MEATKAGSRRAFLNSLTKVPWDFGGRGGDQVSLTRRLHCKLHCEVVFHEVVTVIRKLFTLEAVNLPLSIEERKHGGGGKAFDNRRIPPDLSIMIWPRLSLNTH